MKKISISLFFISTLLIVSWSCKKSSNTPTVSFVASALDSAKVSTLTSFAINNIIQNHIDSFFVSVLPNIPTRIYNKTLYFKYTGDGSDFKVIYTGDVSHIYDPQNDSTANTAAIISNGWYSYQYPKSDTFHVTVLANNVANGGKDIHRGKLTETFIIK